MMKRTITVQHCFVLLCLAVATCDSTNWLQEKNNAFIFYFGDDVNINCNLSDPYINVTLWVGVGKDKVYHQVIPTGGHIQQFNQLFRINNLRPKDAGKYECRADNITSLEALTIHLSNVGVPKPVPRITFQKSDVKYGKDVTLSCSARAHADLTWYKSERNGNKKYWQKLNATSEIVQTMSRSHLSLTIKSFNVSDNGEYICELHRTSVKYTKSSKPVFLSIGDLEKPTFTESPKSQKNLHEGDVLEIYYGVEGTPTPSIAWYKVRGGKEEVLLAKCIDGDCLKINDDYEITNYDLYHEKVSFPNNNVTLKCVISSFLGSATRQITVNVKAKPKILLNNERDLIHVYKGHSGTDLVCKVEEANPYEITFTWRVQPTDCTAKCTPNDSDWSVITAGKDDGFEIETSNGKSTLSITKQTKQHLFFQCSAKNEIGEDQKEWTVIPVTGMKPLKAKQKLVEVDEGEDVQLSCEVAKYTSNKVAWKYNNTLVQLGSNMRVENSTMNGTVYNTLHIKRINVTDAGKYKCFGEFKGAYTDARIRLIVRELRAPVVTLKKLTKEQGSSIVVRCIVSGHPKPKISWKKDGKVLTTIGTFSKIDDCSTRQKGIYSLSNGEKSHANTLIICKADFKEHLGQFSCTARNKLGNDTATAFINITAPPEISDFETTTAELGEEFLLTCHASGNPEPRVWWMKKDKKTSKFILFENEASNTLHFKIVDKSNIGDYQCVAQNGIGTKTMNYTLNTQPVLAASSVAPNNSKKYAVVIGCVSFFILAIVIIVAVILYKRKKIYGGFYILTLPPLPDYIKKLDPHTPLTEQTNKLPYDAEWEFPRNRLKFSRELGSGAFGKVFLADAMGIVAFDPRNSTKRRSSRRRFGGSVRRNHYVNNNKMTKVAVKTLKEDSGETEYKDLLSELKILIHVGEHKNIVNLLGACTKGRESELWVIIEYCSNGNLLQFLRNRRDIYETEWKGVSKDPNIQLTMTDLVIAAYQIARGMEFLASRLCIHRDLATRNILVMDNYVIKIADFGLARDVGEDSQYVKTSNGLLPVKWMAIEAIVQRLFTEKSDVWSFGIVLWELFTLGGTPYPNIPPQEVAEFLVRGHRMEPPHACPDEISTLMMKCWYEDKDSRPTFKELVQILDKIIELHTSSEDGCGYLEVQEEVPMNEYLIPSEVKSPQMDPFECHSPLPPIPSPGVNERDSLLLRDQNSRGKKFEFDKAMKNKAARQDSEIEKIQNDHTPEIIKNPDVQCRQGSNLDGYIDTSLTGKEKERIEQELEKDRDSSEEPHHLGDYAYWKKSVV